MWSERVRRIGCQLVDMWRWKENFAEVGEANLMVRYLNEKLNSGLSREMVRDRDLWRNSIVGNLNMFKHGKGR